MNEGSAPLRILVVDDESPARRAIQRLLAAIKEAIHVEEASDGVEASEKIADFDPDLVFLDIEMPSVGGFDLLGKFPNRRFEVIFVTAYRDFALRAFDSHASDYLLKPVNAERFKVAFEKARERLSARKGRSAAVNRSIQASNQNFLDSFFVRLGAHSTQIFSENIIMLSAVSGGTEIQTAERSYHSDETLSFFSDKLDSNLFFRVRRNAIVHRKFIRKVIHQFPMILILSQGSEITVAKERRSDVRQWLSADFPEHGPR